MSYKWCNDSKLDILQASGQDSKLIFKSDKDTAEVFIEGNDISKVIYTNAEKVFTIQNSEAKQVTVGEGNTHSIFCSSVVLSELFNFHTKTK